MESSHEILGVALDASKEEIKTAFHKLAIKHHPDKGAPDNGAFLRIRKAYDALMASEEGKKATYDRLKTQKVRKKDGGDLRVSMKASVTDLIECKRKYIRISRKILCQDCKGSGSADGKVNICQSCGGSGVDPVSLVVGAKKPCRKCGGEGSRPGWNICIKCHGTGLVAMEERVTLDLNPSVVSSMLVRGKGNDSRTGGPPGNLTVDVEIEKDPNWQLWGLNLRRTIEISPAQAVLGDTVEMLVFDKSTVLEIPAGITHGQMVKKEGAGVSYEGKTGDLSVFVKIKVPIILPDEQRVLYFQLLKLEKENSCQNL